MPLTLFRHALVTILLGLGGLSLAACDDADTPEEQVGEAVEEAGDAVEDATEDAADAVEDATE
ncbi:MAG TPA: hypothetical protein VFO41_09095 [Alphaproteobacteria bacterium]|nr:hypothetical protein [Alphaproteobacteria bacterium]